jgi:hypothetical protein
MPGTKVAYWKARSMEGQDMKSVYLGVLAVLALTTFNASAVAPRPPNPKQNVIEISASSLSDYREKDYDCALIGSVENGNLFSSNTVAEHVRATDLKLATEAAVAPFKLIEQGQNGAPIRVMVEGLVFRVERVRCIERATNI